MDRHVEAWYAEYAERHTTYESAAVRVQQTLSEALTSRPIALHTVVARAKSPASAYQKLIEKGYDQPGDQMTDLLAARVIVTYTHGVAEAVERLRSKFTVDEANSVDKTSVLAEDRFGYRGVHLVLTLGKTGDLGPIGEILRTHKVEVQVRSVVEHAWAEIDHELRYKSGITLGSELTRRFNALAGVLELVDREFSRIEIALIDEIRRLVERCALGDLPSDLNTTTLLAILVDRRPSGRPLGPHHLPLPLREAAIFVRQLRSVGLTDPASLVGALGAPEVRDIVRLYADGQGLEPEEASARVVLQTLLGLRVESGSVESVVEDLALRDLVLIGRVGVTGLD